MAHVPNLRTQLLMISMLLKPLPIPTSYWNGFPISATKRITWHFLLLATNIMYITTVMMALMTFNLPPNLHSAK